MTQIESTQVYSKWDRPKLAQIWITPIGPKLGSPQVIPNWDRPKLSQSGIIPSCLRMLGSKFHKNPSWFGIDKVGLQCLSVSQSVLMRNHRGWLKSISLKKVQKKCFDENYPFLEGMCKLLIPKKNQNSQMSEVPGGEGATRGSDNVRNLEKNNLELPL